MISELLSSILYLLPFAKKHVYPQSKFEDDIQVDVRSGAPVNFNLTCAIPEVSIYLKVTNKSQYLEAHFDRAILSAWLHGNDGLRMVLKDIPLISKSCIDKKKDEEIYLCYQLNRYHVKQLEQVADDRDLAVTLEIEYYIESQMYNFSRRISLERRPCRIIGGSC